MDKLNKYKRLNQAIAQNPELFEILNKKMKKAYQSPKQNIIKIIAKYIYFKKQFYKIPLDNSSNTIKILLVGELYTIMDNEASNNLEQTLINAGIVIYRYTDLTYLLLKKKFKHKNKLVKSKKYLKYDLGADGTESIYYTLKHCKKGIDGIIHVKSYGCVPEINAMPILEKISEDYKIPILYLSFDGENNIANIDTKIEAFYEMIKAKKQIKK